MLIQKKSSFGQALNAMLSNSLQHVSNVKVDHCHSASLLQPQDIPMTKWEVISMAFIIGLSLTPQRHNVILVVVDKLTKSTNFIPVRETYEVVDVA